MCAQAKQVTELIAGERRLRACQSIGLKSIPAVIKNITDQACLALAVIENIQRQDLNVVELAYSLHSLASKYGMTHAEVGRIVGKSRAAVSNLIRLLGLSEVVKNHLVEGLIEMGHARCLLSLSKDQQAKFSKEIIEKAAFSTRCRASCEAVSRRGKANKGVTGAN